MKTIKWIFLFLIPVLIFSVGVYNTMITVDAEKSLSIVKSGRFKDFTYNSLDIASKHIDELNEINSADYHLPEISDSTLKELQKKYELMYSDYSDYLRLLSTDFLDKINEITFLKELSRSIFINNVIIVILILIELILILFTVIRLKKARSENS